VARGASGAEIKKAYYALAKQWHPDANKSAEAEERFQELSKAYEVLKDEEQRRVYDATGAAGYEARYNGAGGGGGRGGFGGFGFPDFGGGRAMDQSEFEDLLGSFFSGGVRPNRDLVAQLALTLAEVKAGARKSVHVGGRRVDVDIPPGMEEGMRLRLEGQGQPATGKVKAGNLYVEVTVIPHPRFRRLGADLVLRESVSLADAALGCTLKLPTLEGATAEVRLPPGTQTGETLRVRGKGMPVLSGGGQTGDLLVMIEVRVPRSLSPRARELLEELQSLGGV